MYCVLQQCSSHCLSDSTSSSSSSDDNVEYKMVSETTAVAAAPAITNSAYCNSKKRQRQLYFKQLRQKVEIMNRKHSFNKHQFLLCGRRQDKHRKQGQPHEVSYLNQQHQRQIDQLYLHDALLPRHLNNCVTVQHNDEHCELEVISVSVGCGFFQYLFCNCHTQP